MGGWVDELIDLMKGETKSDQKQNKRMEREGEREREWTEQHQKVLVQFLTSQTIDTEWSQIKSGLSLLTLKETPLLEFLFHGFVVDFPWLRSQPKTFWLKVEELVRLASNFTAISQFEGRSSSKRLVRRLKRLGAVIAKNIFLPKMTSQSLEPSSLDDLFAPIAESLQRKSLSSSLSSSSSSPSSSSPAFDSPFEVEVISGREIVENGEKFVGYVIEARIGRFKGRTVHRYNDFQLVHSTVCVSSPPFLDQTSQQIRQQLIRSEERLTKKR